MLYIFIGAILLFIIAIVSFKIIKNTVKVMFLIVGLLILIVVSSSVLLYLDAKDLRENLLVSKGEVIITNNDNVIAGFEFYLDNFNTTLFNGDKIKKINKLYKTSYKNVLGDNYKLMIISMKALNNSLTDNVKIDKQIMSKNEVFELLKSNDPIELYLDKVVNKLINVDDSNKKDIKEAIRNNLQVKDNSEFKSLLSSLIFEQIIETDPEKLIYEYKKGTVIMYPETILLKMFKILPDDYIKQKFENMKVYLKDKLTNKISENIGFDNISELKYLINKSLNSSINKTKILSK